jgi:triosephosphate isomerase
VARTPLVSGNWKMHMNHLEALQLVQRLHYALDGHDHDAVEVSVHPPFTALRTVQTSIDADRMKLVLGAQNCHHETSGAFTGEISPEMLAKLAVRYVIVGHSERRQLFGETDEVVAAKAAAVVAAGMTPIVCVGETLEERDAGSAEQVVGGQVRGSLASLTAEQVAAAVVAYEPVWAIGTGRNASAEDAQAMCAHVRAVVGELAGADAAAAVRIQYGGSVKPVNAHELLTQPDIDGALVGGASLEAESFARIVGHDHAQ